MASSPIIFSVLLFIIFSFSSTSFSQSTFRPKALILPITKDKTTLQYTTVLNLGTPLVEVPLVFNLGGRDLWFECRDLYFSTTYKPSLCHSSVCSRAGSQSCSHCNSDFVPGCSDRPCDLSPDNTIAGIATSGEVSLDVLSIQSTNGSNTGPVIKIPNTIFSCGDPAIYFKKGLANGTTGMAGMGRHSIGLPSQFASALNIKRKFAVCLSSGGRGVAFFGNGPYVFLPGIQISRLTTTPLLINPVRTLSPYFEFSRVPRPNTTSEKSSEYFIGVTTIKIAEKTVPINNALLKINQKTGYGGTKISTVNPYTLMERSIFQSFTTAFVKAATAMNITRVTSVKPFGACFSTRNVVTTRLGYAVPEINLVLQSKDVVWRIFGANSMVSVKKDVMCLGFVDGGVKPRTSIVIGGFQLEDNLLEFDLASNKLGFSSTLLGRRTNCANFNFTSV